MVFRVLVNNGGHEGLLHVFTYLLSMAREYMVILLICTATVMGSLQPKAIELMTAKERENFALGLESVEGRIQNIKIDTESWIERRPSLSEPWEKTPIHVIATAWVGGLSMNKSRVDVHEQVLEWYEGTAPYFQSSFTVAFDGLSGKNIEHTFGYNGNVFLRKRATILPNAPERLRAGWFGTFTGIDASVHFFSHKKGYKLSHLIRQVGNLNVTGPNTEIEIRKKENYHGQDVFRVDVIGSGKSRTIYWLDPSRSYSILESMSVYTGEDNLEKIKFRTEVNKLKEVIPGVWYPAEAAFERPSSGPTRSEKPYERVVYRALNIVVNDPNFDEDIFTVPIQDGYFVDDKVEGMKYRVVNGHKIEEK